MQTRPTNLFRMLKLPHEGIVVFLCDTFWVARHGFNVRFEEALQQLVHLRVVIVIVSDPEHTMYVVPDRTTER